MKPRLLKTGLALALFLVCFAFYYVTLAPTITWEHDGVDSGDLVTAVHTLGIAHPPGYPLFIVLGKAFTILPLGDAAYRVNLMSALCAAIAASLVYGTVLLLLPQNLDELSGTIIAAASALLLAFSRTLWSQAIIAEVYSLNALLVSLMVYLVTQFRSSGNHNLLWALSLTLGLSLGNHLSALLLAPGMLFLILRRGRLAWRNYLGMIACFLLGLSVYLYLPLRSAQHPPIDWGAPHTWRGFWWAVSASIYRHYVFGVPLLYLPGRIATWMTMLAQQVTWPGVALGLMGIWNLRENDLQYLIFSLTSFFAVAAYALTYNTTDSYLYLIPTYLLFALWMARGASCLLSEIVQPWITTRKGLPETRPHLMSLISLSLVILPIFLIHSNYSALDLSTDRTAIDYAADVFTHTPADALIIADTDPHIFSLWYFRYVVSGEPEAVVVAKDLLHYQWYRENLTRHHPHIDVPPNNGGPYAELLALIDANLPYRPVYLTDPDDRILALYPHSRVGSLYRLGLKG